MIDSLSMIWKHGIFFNHFSTKNKRIFRIERERREGGLTTVSGVSSNNSNNNNHMHQAPRKRVCKMLLLFFVLKMEFLSIWFIPKANIHFSKNEQIAEYGMNFRPPFLPTCCLNKTINRRKTSMKTWVHRFRRWNIPNTHPFLMGMVPKSLRTNCRCQSRELKWVKPEK